MYVTKTVNNKPITTDVPSKLKMYSFRFILILVRNCHDLFGRNLMDPMLFLKVQMGPMLFLKVSLFYE